MNHKLGIVMRDQITGFEGVVVCITEWRGSVDQVELTPQKLRKGVPVERQSFDVTRCEIVNPEEVVTVAEVGEAPFKVGDTIKDKVCGVEGVCKYVCRWVTGCYTAGITVPGMHEGKAYPLHHAQAIDCEIVKKAKTKKARTGGPAMCVPTRP